MGAAERPHDTLHFSNGTFIFRAPVLAVLGGLLTAPDRPPATDPNRTSGDRRLGAPALTTSTRSGGWPIRRVVPCSGRPALPPFDRLRAA